MNIVIAILLFSLIVIIHEIGHFVAARKCGILVEEFALGMGPKLFGIRRGETLFTLRLFPIGGSCRMLGEDGEPKKKGVETEEEAETKEDAVKSERSFMSKSVPKRIIVILAGVIMNILLAFVATFAILAANRVVDAKVDSVMTGYPAEAAGLKPGDRINRLNGTKIFIRADIQMVMDNADGGAMDMEVIRDGKKINVNITPMYVESEGRYMIGFSYKEMLGMFAKTQTERDETLPRATFLETAAISANTCIYYVKHTLDGIGMLVTRKVGVKDLSGPIGIVSFIGDAYEESLGENNDGWAAFWNMLSLAAMLSANLAVFNFLPLPALDGGRLVFLLIEGVRGKPISPEKEGIIHFAGLVLLMIFAVFVAYNDILKLI